MDCESDTDSTMSDESDESNDTWALENARLKVVNADMSMLSNSINAMDRRKRDSVVDISKKEKVTDCII
jgi:hypothetical protein